jgi:hypothetical protein
LSDYVRYLADFRKQIEDGYSRHAYLNHLVFSVRTVSEPASIFPRGNGPTGAQSSQGEAVPEPYAVSTRIVTPNDIGFHVQVRDWMKAPEGTLMGTLMELIATKIAENEVLVLVEDLTKTAGKQFQATNALRLSKADLRSAIQWIGNNGFQPDRVLVSPELESQLMLKNEVIEKWHFPSFMADRGNHHSGKVDGLDLFWDYSLKGRAIVYESYNVTFAKTDLKVTFDDVQNPTELIVQCWCSCAPLDERSVALITV